MPARFATAYVKECAENDIAVIALEGADYVNGGFKLRIERLVWYHNEPTGDWQRFLAGCNNRALCDVTEWQDEPNLILAILTMTRDEWLKWHC